MTISGDSSLSKHVGSELEALLKQQSSLARFGELALRSENLDEILTEVCRLVADALGTELAKVLELQEDGQTLLVKAGIGWNPGVVGHVCVEADEDSSEGHALRTGEPVISTDTRQETRFTLPAFLHDHGVQALVNVAIIGGNGRGPYGVLEVDSREPRQFRDSDIAFLRGYANLLAAAVDRLRMMGELRRSEAFANSVLAASPDCIKVLDADSTVRFMSENGLRMIGAQTPAQVLGRDLADLWPEAEQAEIHDAVARAASGETTRVQGKSLITHGTPRCFEVCFAPLPGVDGELSQVVGISRDVTARTLSEQAHRETEERLRVIFEAVPVGVVICEAPTGRIIAGNSAAERVFRHPILNSPDVESYKNWVSFHADGRRVMGFEYPLARALRGEDQPSLEVHYQFDDGSRSWVLLSAATLRDAVGAITGAVVTAQDIDLQKRAATMLQQSNVTLEAKVETSARNLVQSNRDLVAEIGNRQVAEGMVRQLQKMEVVGQLTGGIAHDFNNMLAVVMSGLNLIQRRLARGDTDINRFVDAALDGAMRAGALTQRLLAFSRQQTLSPVPLDANKLLSGMEDLLHRTLGEAVQVETVLAAQLWMVHTDPSQLENAILNLAVNSRDAMDNAGKLTVETANTRLDDAYAREHEEVVAGQYVMVAVSDTGSGMTSAVMAQVFDPYFTTKDVGKGTGLGLSQVYGFVKQSGGHIKIYSEPGQGTSIKIYLPRFYGEEITSLRKTMMAPPAIGSRDQIILVVEDEVRVRELTVAAVRELGYTAIHADSATSALRQLDQHPDVTLLFTDVVMPDMNGRRLSEEARRRRPTIKVLFTTGYTQDAVVHNSVLDPTVHLLPKPFTVEQLAFKLHEIIGSD